MNLPQPETGIPLTEPTRSRLVNGYQAAVWRLRSGESIFLPGKDTLYASRRIHRVRKQRPKAQYASRAVEGGVRIWCLADGRGPVTAADLLA